MSRTLDRSVSPRHRAGSNRRRPFARGNGAVVFGTGRRYAWGRRGETYVIWDKRHPNDVLGHSWEANARREFQWLEDEATQRRRRRWRRLSIALGLVLAVLVAAAIALKASVDPATDPAPAEPALDRAVGRYVNVGGGYGFSAPTDWSVLSASSTAQVTSPGGTVTISVQVAPEGAVGTASEAFVGDLTAAWTDVQTEAAQPRTVGDLPGLSVGGDAIDENGEPIRFHTIVIDSGARNHAISVVVPRAWNAALFMPAVEVVASSFRPVDSP